MCLNLIITYIWFAKLTAQSENGTLFLLSFFSQRFVRTTSVLQTALLVTLTFSKNSEFHAF